MECPYCKKDMQSGYLVANSRIVWNSRYKGFGGRWLDKKEGDILVSDRYLNLWELAKKEASLCRDCNVIIVHLPNEP